MPSTERRTEDESGATDYMYSSRLGRDHISERSTYVAFVPLSKAVVPSFSAPRCNGFNSVVARRI